MYQLIQVNDRHANIRDMEADLVVRAFLGADAGLRAAGYLLELATNPEARPAVGVIHL